MTRDNREQVEQKIKVEQEIDKDKDELTEEDLEPVVGGVTAKGNIEVFGGLTN